MGRAGTWLLGLLAAPGLLSNATPAIACAMCRATLLNEQGGGDLLGGLRQGVLLLLAVPLLIVGTMILHWKRAAKAGCSKPRWGVAEDLSDK
jgi:hypothetical protein